MRVPALSISVVVLLAACAVEEATFADRLEGLWTLEDSQLACVHALRLEGGEFKRGRLCELMSGQIAAEVTEGSYAIAGNQITLFARVSSCADYVADSSTYEVALLDGDETLRVRAPDGTLLFERLHDDGEPSMGVAVANGCFVNGVFQQGPIEPLR